MYMYFAMRHYVKSEYSLVNIDLVTFINVKKWAPGTVVAVMMCQFLRNDDWANFKLNSLEQIYRARTEFPVSHAMHPLEHAK